MEIKVDLTDLELEKNIDNEIEKGIERAHKYEPSKYIELILLQRISRSLDKLLQQERKKL